MASVAYFTEQAPTPLECMNKIRSKYGIRAKVMNQRTVRVGGFLGIGGHEETEMSGFFDYGSAAYTPGFGPASAAEPRPAFNLEEEKKKIFAIAGKDPARIAEAVSTQDILKEIRSLSEKMDAKLVQQTEKENPDHPVLTKLEEDLLCNDFSPSYVKTMIDRVRREFALEDLDDYEKVQDSAARWIGESISIHRENPDAGKTPAGKKRPRIVVLVGPTGVGKTTTIAKLATLYGGYSKTEGRLQKEVRLVTLDYYRLGGKEQIEKYGEIMGIPFSLVHNHDGLQSVLSLYRRDVDFILVDTIGHSPRNAGELGRMKETLDACGPRAETHLCLSASTKSSDIAEIVKQFEPFKYNSLIITKLDETSGIGNVISALSKTGKAVSFLTNGQKVPDDIERASALYFLKCLEGFSFDRERLAGYFGTENGVLQDTI